MMNRIMFIYFLQKHYVIQNNTDFLLQKFDEVTAIGKDYYKDFLLPLFFYGFARRDNHPEKQKFVKEYGAIRYLNGGLFYPHYLEKKYTDENVKASINQEEALQTNIGIDSKLLKEILTFLNGYTWYLDNRPMKEDTDINPDVLGYIFEKYINQKELGAYYTKEDITEYISKNTIIPFILDKMKAKGFNAPDPNPMITNNEDIIGNIGNYIDTIDNYEEVKYLYKDVLLELSVLDPAVGSGAFLFAALNILLPIYQKTVFRLKEFNKTVNDNWLKETIDTISNHAEEYFLTKQIILNNLYGVDIVEEATEICKLRLFLQLASHLPDITSIEPLPDIDFNIYAGNSLVGGLSWEDIEYNYKSLFNKDGEAINAEILKEKIEQLTQLKQKYRAIQQQDDSEEELSILKGDISFLDHNINNEINLKIDNPFHWFIDFNKIIMKGGFDVIIGNPPYVEYSKVKKEYQIINYKTEKSGNIYANFIERALEISNNKIIGFIIPLSLSSTKRMVNVRNLFNNKKNITWISSYDLFPSRLFTGAGQRLNILITKESKEFEFFTTKYYRWFADERDLLFSKIKYSNNKNNITIDTNWWKTGNNIEVSIINKVLKHKNYIKNYLKDDSDKVIYVHRIANNFIKCLDFIPKFESKKYGQKKSDDYKLYKPNDIKSHSVLLSLINSSLFYMFWRIRGDGYHCGKEYVETFPIEINNIENTLIDKLSRLSKKIMVDFNSNSAIRKEYYKKSDDTITYQMFYLRNSKKLMDEIDEILGEVYSFTEKELDYIINYDIKYRMGNQKIVN